MVFLVVVLGVGPFQWCHKAMYEFIHVSLYSWVGSSLQKGDREKKIKCVRVICYLDPGSSMNYTILVKGHSGR